MDSHLKRHISNALEDPAIHDPFGLLVGFVVQSHSIIQFFLLHFQPMLLEVEVNIQLLPYHNHFHPVLLN